jgi:hypothetical protein
MSQVWDLQGIGSTEKLVLLAIADNGNDQGVCWPSMATLARKTALTERGIQKVLVRLEELRLVGRIERPGRSNVYQVTIEAPPNAVHPTPEPRSPHPRTVFTQNHQVTVIEPPIPPNPPRGERFDAKQVEGLDQAAWAEWLAYRAKRKPAIKPASMKKAAQAMAALGGQQQLAVDHSIAAGYQGLVVPKETHATRIQGHRPTRHDQLAAHLDAELEVAPVLEGHARPLRNAVGRELRLESAAHVGHAALRVVGG